MVLLPSHLAIAATLLSSAQALSSIEIKAQDFTDPSTGNRFEIFGIAYQPGGSAGFNPSSGVDPLSNPEMCIRDAALMQKLGLNTIRVYNLDPALNHDECVSIFDYAGIYMLIDVNSPMPGQAINQLDPSSTYDATYLKRVFQVIDNFRGYPNLLGFISANELINDVDTGLIDPPYVRVRSPYSRHIS